MKKIILSIFALVFAFGVNMVFAEVNSVTPSTNDFNRDSNWAHFNSDPGVGYVDLEFVSTRGFYSCFEYRTDGDITEQIGSTNYNPDVTDGLYPYVCVNNETKTKHLLADEYVEVRMVFGAESDERFDWTRVDVIFNRTAAITSPNDGEVVSGNVDFNAVLNDKDGDDNVQWAVRKGTCGSGIGTVLGNVDGYSDDYEWDGTAFHASADVSLWADGDYCFIFNPSESSGDIQIRETKEFVVSNPPTNINQCKKDGWMTFNNLSFKNQGACVSYIKANDKAGKR